MIYLLDANVLIQAKRFYYGMDFCPGFWQWLDGAYESGAIATIRPVADEILDGADDLSDWLQERDEPDLVWAVDDDDTQTRYGEVVSYVASAGYTAAAVTKFFQKDADAQLIAKALVSNVGVVTLEKPHPLEPGRVHIPEICDHFDVKWIDTYDLLRMNRAQFVLAE